MIDPLVTLFETHPESRQRLRRLFHAMDREFDRVARHYRFDCNGCPDNCCRSRFHHHTLVEFAYLAEGFRRLEHPIRREVADRAQAAVAAPAEAGEPIRIWCPLSESGRCRLYAHRPMVCRLHGIPHVLRPPGRPPLHGPGCGQCRPADAGDGIVKLDRTPLYAEMAALERDVRRKTGITEKLKLTVAEIICRIA